MGVRPNGQIPYEASSAIFTMSKKFVTAIDCHFFAFGGSLIFERSCTVAAVPRLNFFGLLAAERGKYYVTID